MDAHRHWNTTARTRGQETQQGIIRGAIAGEIAQAVEAGGAHDLWNENAWQDSPTREQAMRERAEARVHPIARLKALAKQAGQREFNPVELMRGHAENLSERGASLKKVADAWQSLYQTLNPDQKERLRLLAMNVVREIREAVRNRRMEMMELEEDEAD